MNVLFTSYYKGHEVFSEWLESSLLVAEREAGRDNVFFANSEFKGKRRGVVFLKFPRLRFVPVVYSIVTFFYFLYFVLKYRVDWIYAQDSFTLFPAFLVSKFLRKRLFVTVRGCWFCCNGFYCYHDGFSCTGSLSDELVAYPIWRWPVEFYRHYQVVFSRFLLRHSDVIAVSEFLQGLLAEYGIDSRVDYSQNLFDFRFVKGAKRLKKYYGQKVVLFVGPLVRGMGVDLLIEAFAEVDRSRSVLVIVGSGPEEARLKELAKGVNVEFVTRVGKKKLFDYFSSASIFVYPVLRTVGFSKVVELAKLMDKPVIATINGGLPEQLRSYKDGLLVPTLDVNALIVSLKKFFSKR